MTLSELDELRIIMVAPRGIGKTSLLAAMHAEFDKTFQRANLQIWPEESKTSIAIEECKRLLKNIDSRLKKAAVPTTIAEDPWSDEGFLFDIGSGNKRFLRLRFTDPAGEYFKSNATPEQKQYIKEQLNECDAVIIPIDATALMETKTGKVKSTEIGTWHEEKNDPYRITTLLKDAYENLQHPRLVILAPLKSESYTKTPKDAEDLLDHVKIGYRELLEFFKQESLIKNLAVVVTPVQTIGNIKFAYHTVDENNFTRFSYHKVPINAPYEPKHGDQPLRYILRFLLNISVENQNILLEQEQQRLAELEKDLWSKKDELEAAQNDFEHQKEKFEKRQATWKPVRMIANLFDNRETPYEEAKSKFTKNKERVEETHQSLIQGQTKIEATQAQIEAFNNAISIFARDCKIDEGFAVLQGAAKWLTIPKN